MAGPAFFPAVVAILVCAALSALGVGVFFARMTHHRLPHVSVSQLLFTRAAVQKENLQPAGHPDQRRMVLSLLLLAVCVGALQVLHTQMPAAPQPDGDTPVTSGGDWVE